MSLQLLDNHSHSTTFVSHQNTVFSEREFTFVRYNRASVCLSSVTSVHPTQAIEIFGNTFISYERSLILVF